MGFFSEIASEARRSGRSGAPPQPATAEQQHVLPQEAPPEPAPTPPEPVPAAPGPEPAMPPAKPAAQLSVPPAPTPPSELKLDTTQDATPAPDDDAKRKAHEAAEAKRKAEFDARQAEKKAARQAALDRIAAMNGAELLAASVERVAADTERLTRRNMKTMVAEHIQAKCRADAAFAMLVMDPAKSMVNCFKYINRQAQKYAEEEMKDQGIQRTGAYGLDVPDGLCFQWAEDYFKDENAEEDHKNDEKFVPKPYVPASAPLKKTQSKADKKPAPAAKPKAEKQGRDNTGMEQLTLGVI